MMSKLCFHNSFVAGQPTIPQWMQEYLTQKIFGCLYGKSQKSRFDRTLGFEAEWFLIQDNRLGIPGDNRRLFQVFENKQRYEQLTMLGLDGQQVVRGYLDTLSGFSVITEAGISTIEVLSPVFTNLVEMYQETTKFLTELLDVIHETGQLLIATGIQPTIHRLNMLHELWFPALRYHRLRDLFLKQYHDDSFLQYFNWAGNDFRNLYRQYVNAVTMTASIQPHVELHSPQESFLALEVMQYLTPAFLTLFRNSPIYSVDPSDVRSLRPDQRVFAARQLLWHAVNPQQAGFRSVPETQEQFVQQVAQSMCYFTTREDGSGYDEYNKPFATLNSDAISDASLAFTRGTDFSVFRIVSHDSGHGTGEFRPVGQQSLFHGGNKDEQLLPMMSVLALNLGVMCSLSQQQATIQATGITEAGILRWYRAAQKHKHKLDLSASFNNILYGMFDIAYKALKDRGVGEEVFLDNLKKYRKEVSLLEYPQASQNGGHPHLEAFGHGGEKGLCEFMDSITFR